MRTQSRLLGIIFCAICFQSSLANAEDPDIDLGITDALPTAIQAGYAFTQFRYQVTNNTSNGVWYGMPFSFDAKVYLSSDSNVNSADTVIRDSSFSGQYDAYETQWETISSVRIPWDTVPGTYWIAVHVIIDDRISSNNWSDPVQVNISHYTTFSASGTALFEGLVDHSGIQVNFTGTGNPSPVITDVSGVWSQDGFIAGATYYAIPQKDGWQFTPPRAELSEGGASPHFVGIVDDHGDSWERATSMGTLNKYNPTCFDSGTIERDVDVDFFRFDPSKGHVRLTVTPMTLPNAEMWLYELDGIDGLTLVGHSDSTSNSPAGAELTVEIESYYNYHYVKVGGVQGMIGAYDLLVEYLGECKASGQVTLEGQSDHSGVTLTFAKVSGTFGTAPDPVQTSGDGLWSQIGDFRSNSTFSVTPELNGWTFTPSSQTFSGGYLNVADLDFVGQQDASFSENQTLCVESDGRFWAMVFDFAASQVSASLDTTGAGSLSFSVVKDRWYGTYVYDYSSGVYTRGLYVLRNPAGPTATPTPTPPTGGDVYEPDDSDAQAKPIVSGSTQAHSIYPVGDEDWVTFTLSQRSEVTIETSGPTGDTRMWLYDAGLSQIEYDDDGGSDFLFSRIERTLDAGAYFVRVDEFGDNNMIDPYYLDLTVIELAGPDGH